MTSPELLEDVSGMIGAIEYHMQGLKHAEGMSDFRVKLYTGLLQSARHHLDMILYHQLEYDNLPDYETSEHASD